MLLRRLPTGVYRNKTDWDVTTIFFRQNNLFLGTSYVTVISIYINTVYLTVVTVVIVILISGEGIILY